MGGSYWRGTLVRRNTVCLGMALPEMDKCLGGRGRWIKSIFIFSYEAPAPLILLNSFHHNKLWYILDMYSVKSIFSFHLWIYPNVHIK